MPRFSLLEWPDAEVTNALAVVDARIEATIPSWSFLEHRHLGPSPPHFSGGASTLRLDAHVRNGELWTGTTIDLQTHTLEVQTPSTTVSTSAETRAEVKEIDGVRTMIVHSNARPFEVRVKGQENEPIRASTLALFATTENLALRKPFNDLRLSLDAPEIELTDLRLFQSALPASSKLRIGEGAAIGRAHLDALLANGAGSGTISVTTHTATVQAGDARMTGTVGIEAKVERVDLSRLDAELAHTTIDLRDVVWTRGGHEEPPWWGVVELDRASLRPSASTKLAIDASIRMRDVRPLLAVYSEAEGMPAWLRSVLAMENFEAKADVRLGDGADVDALRATSKDVSIALKMHAHHDRHWGAVLVVWRGLLLGIDVRPDGAKPVLTDVRAWFDDAR
jgi:hypothetical protein